MGAATRETVGTPAKVRNPRELLIESLPVTERRLSLNGVATAVLEGGSGSPIILLHGPGGYGAQWIHAIPALAATHRVIAPDLPGHGASAFFEGPPTPGRVNDWLDDLIECTCSKPPVLVGHTLGGAIAMHFAAAAGRPLAALVLVDTLGLAAFQPAPAFGAALAGISARADRCHARWPVEPVCVRSRRRETAPRRTVAMDSRVQPGGHAGWRFRAHGLDGAVWSP